MERGCVGVSERERGLDHTQLQDLVRTLDSIPSVRQASDMI